MNPGNQDPLIHDQIRTLIDTWSRAVRDKDLDAIMACYHPAVVAFDAIGLLHFKGQEAYRAHWQHCLQMCPGTMLFEQHELSVHGAGSVAFAHWLNRCGTLENDQEQVGWMRGSAGYRRTADGWKIIHEHFSAPFDMASGKALFDLQP